MRTTLICTAFFVLLVLGCSKSEPTPQSDTSTPATETSTASTTAAGAAEKNSPSDLNVDALMADVKKHFESGDYRSAFPLLDQLHAAQVCPPEGYAIRAQILDHSGLLSQSIASLTIALTKQPKNAEWHNMLGLLFVKAKNLPLAQQAFTKAIELKPDFAKAYNNRGLMLIALKEYGTAINDFNQAIVYDPKYIDAHNNRGYAYLEQGNYAKAVDNFSEAVRLDPEYVKGYNNRGFALVKIGDAEKAIEDFTKAIELAPLTVKHYLHRRDAYLAQGNQQAADADQAQAGWVQNLLLISRKIQRDPKNPGGLIERARHYAANQKFDEAFEDLAQAEKLDTTSASVHTCRAEIYYGQKNYTATIASCTKALEFEQNFEALSMRGDAYLATGKFDEAITDFASAQRFDGSVALAYWQRADNRQQGGDAEGAEQDRQTALKLDPKIEESVKK